MRKLSAEIYRLISSAVNTHGTYEPSEITYLFEEQMTSAQYDAVVPFLQWCHDTGKHFGKGNYQERYQEYLDSKKTKVEVTVDPSVEILSSLYGIEGTMVPMKTVTFGKKLNNRMAGSDPAPGVKKFAEIKYRKDGVEYTGHFEEGQIITTDVK